MPQVETHALLDRVSSLLPYPDKVIPLCDELLASDEMTTMPLVRCQAHLIKGSALRTKGQLELAECELLQAMCLAEQFNDPGRVADAASLLGLLHLESHDYERARRYLTMARNRYIEYGSMEGEARSLCNMSTLLLMEDRQREAMLLLEEAMQGYDAAGSTVGMTHVLTAMAIVRLKQREFELALDHLQRSKQLFLSLDQPKHALVVDLNIAECHIYLGNLSYARVQLASIRSRAQAAEYRPLECRSLLYLSNLEQLEHHPREAADFFYQAREVAQRGGFEAQFEAMQEDCELQKYGE